MIVCRGAASVGGSVETPVVSILCAGGGMVGGR